MWNELVVWLLIMISAYLFIQFCKALTSFGEWLTGHISRKFSRYSTKKES